MFSLYAKLAIIAAIAVGLAMSHWKAYTHGKQVVQAERDKATLVANEVARETERLNRNSKEKALDQRTKEIMQNVAAADTARATAERLLDNSERSLQSARDTHAACVVSATAHAELLGDCQRDYREMAGKAQGHATDAKALIEAWPR
jgi:hypothetical protein